jgi:hypothetical protein
MGKILEGAPGSITAGKINPFKEKIENTVQLKRFVMIYNDS